MTKKSFAELTQEAKSRETFWIAKVIREFTEELHDLMARKNVTKAELARRLNTSPAYITKVLSGNANFTVASMVKFAHVFGYVLHTHMAPKDVAVQWINMLSTTTVTSVYSFDISQNISVEVGLSANPVTPNIEIYSERTLQ